MEASGQPYAPTALLPRNISKIISLCHKEEESLSCHSIRVFTPTLTFEPVSGLS
jgi:hypothetical protein